MGIPLAKLKAILRYFCTFTDTRFLGKTKLMKLFYFIDFLHVKKHGVPITNDMYINLELGPIPTVIKNMVDNVVDDPERAILSDTISINEPDGIKMQQILSFQEFSEDDKGYFNDNELETLKTVCARFGTKNTKAIVDASHNESPWTETKILDKIPYSLAALDKDCSFTREEIEMLQSI